MRHLEAINQTRLNDYQREAAAQQHLLQQEKPQFVASDIPMHVIGTLAQVATLVVLILK